MTLRIASIAAALALGATLATAASAQTTSPAYRYAGSHAGGPANDLIPTGAPRAVVRPVRSPAYAYPGSHAGGPANDLPRR